MSADAPTKMQQVYKIQLPNEEETTTKDVEAAIEIPGNIKTEGIATVRKALHRQVSVHLSGEFGQHLVECFLVLLRISPKEKLAAEWIHDPSINKCKKYKRSASFDSRKVGLFFSILSIIGTTVLIYLTLRVKQTGHVLVHV